MTSVHADCHKLSQKQQVSAITVDLLTEKGAHPEEQMAGVKLGSLKQINGS